MVDGLMNQEATSGGSATFRLPGETQLASLSLRVRDLERALAFYRDLLGLVRADGLGDQVVLAPKDRRFTLELLWDPEAPARPASSLGLYHFALLLPDRPSLAAVVRRLVEARWPFDGASDHGVSEAFYLRDPEENGIELYRDRPREAWPIENGQVAMVSARLDVDELLGDAPRGAPLHPSTRFGHIHLHVADLRDGERFYADTLGLTVTQRTYPGAMFFSAGGYHHHVGINIWGRGRRAPDGATGLVSYAWRVSAGTGRVLEAHLRAQGVPYAHSDAGVALTDPVEVRVVVSEDASVHAGLL